MQKIPCTLFRGGTSKGPFFLKSDLPNDIALRDKMLLKIMGSPDQRQIDGIGGGDSLSSKVAIVSPSDRDDADVNYLFCQVHVENSIVETTLNCGNILSGVGPFAIMNSLVETTHPETIIKIYNENTGVIILSTVQTPKGHITFEGSATIDGVPGTAAPIKLSFLNPVGTKTGTLLMTGNVIDEIDGIAVSCIDVSVPMIITHAKALGKTGYESKNELDADKAFMKRLETIRKHAAIKMGFGDVSYSVKPKICIVSPPRKGGTIHSRYFTPFDCHSAYAVSGALCLAAACFIEGSVANDVATLTMPKDKKFEQSVEIEHVSGKIWTSIVVDKSSNIIDFPVTTCMRTARPLFEGNVILGDL